MQYAKYYFAETNIYIKNTSTKNKKCKVNALKQ